MHAKFHPGRVVGTPGAIDALAASGQDAGFFLDKHTSGDWGEADPEDQAANDAALVDGGRIMSFYRTLQGVKIWLVTEAAGDDGTRASTCLTTPEEY